MAEKFVPGEDLDPLTDGWSQDRSALQLKIALPARANFSTR